MHRGAAALGRHKVATPASWKGCPERPAEHISPRAPVVGATRRAFLCRHKTRDASLVVQLKLHWLADLQLSHDAVRHELGNEHECAASSVIADVAEPGTQVQPCHRAGLGRVRWKKRCVQGLDSSALPPSHRREMVQRR